MTRSSLLGLFLAIGNIARGVKGFTNAVSGTAKVLIAVFSGLFIILAAVHRITDGISRSLQLIGINTGGGFNQLLENQESAIDKRKKA